VLVLMGKKKKKTKNKDGIKELVDRDEDRATKRQAEKRQASDKEREGRLKRHASLAEGREIVPNLFLGGRLAAQNWEWLQQCNIRTIVNVTGDVSNYYEAEEGFRYHRFEIEDALGANISVHFDATADVIRKELEEGRAVFCHCREGLSRSPTIVTAFLMQEMNMGVEEALKVCVFVLPTMMSKALFAENSCSKRWLKRRTASFESTKGFFPSSTACTNNSSTSTRPFSILASERKRCRTTT